MPSSLSSQAITLTFHDQINDSGLDSNDEILMDHWGHINAEIGKLPYEDFSSKTIHRRTLTSIKDIEKIYSSGFQGIL